MSDGPINDRETRFLVKIKFLIVLMKVKNIQLHYTKIPSKEMIRQKFLRDEFSKRNQKSSTNWQKNGLKTQTIILEKILNQYKNFKHVGTENTFQNSEISTIESCIVPLRSNFGLRSAQWSVVFCLNGFLERTHTSSSALGSTRSQFFVQPWWSKFSNSSSFKLPKISLNTSFQMLRRQ